VFEHIGHVTLQLAEVSEGLRNISIVWNVTIYVACIGNTRPPLLLMLVVLGPPCQAELLFPIWMAYWTKHHFVPLIRSQIYIFDAASALPPHLSGIFQPIKVTFHRQILVSRGKPA
jgi:hypothetical protein